jgi:hypothetical protein
LIEANKEARGTVTCEVHIARVTRDVAEACFVDACWDILEVVKSNCAGGGDVDLLAASDGDSLVRRALAVSGKDEAERYEGRGELGLTMWHSSVQLVKTVS